MSTNCGTLAITFSSHYQDLRKHSVSGGMLVQDPFWQCCYPNVPIGHRELTLKAWMVDNCACADSGKAHIALACPCHVPPSTLASWQPQSGPPFLGIALRQGSRCVCSRSVQMLSHAAVLARFRANRMSLGMFPIFWSSILHRAAECDWNGPVRGSRWSIVKQLIIIPLRK